MIPNTAHPTPTLPTAAGSTRQPGPKLPATRDAYACKAVIECFGFGVFDPGEVEEAPPEETEDEEDEEEEEEEDASDTVALGGGEGGGGERGRRESSSSASSSSSSSSPYSSAPNEGPLL